MTKVDFTLTGCANGHPVRVQGTGRVTASRLQVAFAAADCQGPGKRDHLEIGQAGPLGLGVG